VPHLAVAVRERVAVVGPLVLPGTSACLRCLDLHRRDRDPFWPVVAAQLVSARVATAACDVTLATLAAGQAALHALLLLDGGPPPPSVGGTIETDVADGRTRRRSWTAHPACGCQW
ncbi:MAG: thiamine biosynthesis protein ThiF, partial [Actinomycetota bacterium]|nr:thiamine biosynthesis protein ThiF [Actinomycetota bacterium]